MMSFDNLQTSFPKSTVICKLVFLSHTSIYTNKCPVNTFVGETYTFSAENTDKSFYVSTLR